MNTIKCVYCSKKVDVTKKGTVKPHIVHKGKQCIGNGANATQMAEHRKFLDAFAKKRKG
jgi:hypothetical protein